MRAPSWKRRTARTRRTGRTSPAKIAWEILRESSLCLRGLPDGLLIEISGPAAKIPALKNSKVPGVNATNPAHLGRIFALDRLFLNAAAETQIGNPFDPDEPVFLVALIGHRPNSFDPDNCLTTLKDWLEPPTKPVGKKRRGWGIGLVSDDRLVSGFAVAARDLGSRDPRTILSLRKLSAVRSHVQDFLLALDFPTINPRREALTNA